MMTKKQKVGYCLLIAVFSVIFNALFDSLLIRLLLITLTGIGIILLAEGETE